MSFIYLGRLITVMYDDYLTFIVNLQKARKSWNRLLRILGQEISDDRPSGRFYLDIVQTFFLFGSLDWFMNHYIGQLMGGFHHTVVHQILGIHPWH